jgi:hypothetical protein
MPDLNPALERFAAQLTLAIVVATLRTLARPPRRRVRRREKPAVRPPPPASEPADAFTSPCPPGCGSGHEDELGPAFQYVSGW